MLNLVCQQFFQKKSLIFQSAIIGIRRNVGLLVALLLKVAIMRKSHTHQHQAYNHGDFGQSGKQQDGGKHAIEREDEADASDDGVESAIH